MIFVIGFTIYIIYLISLVITLLAPKEIELQERFKKDKKK